MFNVFEMVCLSIVAVCFVTAVIDQFVKELKDYLGQEVTNKAA